VIALFLLQVAVLTIIVDDAANSSVMTDSVLFFNHSLVCITNYLFILYTWVFASEWCWLIIQTYLRPHESLTRPLTLASNMTFMTGWFRIIHYRKYFEKTWKEIFDQCSTGIKKKSINYKLWISNEYKRRVNPFQMLVSYS
jgi:hypothetical protein